MYKGYSGDAIDTVKHADTGIPEDVDLYEHKYNWHEVCAIITEAKHNTMEIYDVGEENYKLLNKIKKNRPSEAKDE